MTNSSRNCPKCKSSWDGGKIIDVFREKYPDKTDEEVTKIASNYSGTNFSRLIGIEVCGVYDGVLYWQCPDCEVKIQRFPEGSRQAIRAAELGAIRIEQQGEAG